MRHYLGLTKVVPVHLSPRDYELYYNGCCNATFWPLFHSMPDRAVFDETFWQVKCLESHLYHKALCMVIQLVLTRSSLAQDSGQM